jgi:GNAT superfamily N-acetyltransferase
MSPTSNGHDATAQQAGDDEYARIVRAGVERLDEPAPLWRSFAAHSTAVGVPIGPPLDPRESWHRARRQHAAHLDHPGSFLLLAEHDSRVIGYALISVESIPNTMWDVDHRRARLEYLSVQPEDRNHGVGSALINATKAELRAVGLRRLTLGVLAGNEDAQRLYRRHGFAVRLLQMTAQL